MKRDRDTYTNNNLMSIQQQLDDNNDAEDRKNRGNYRCSRCNLPKKGHVCPYQQRFRKKDSIIEGSVNDMAVQVEIDPKMTIRQLDISKQGLLESYITNKSNITISKLTNDDGSNSSSKSISNSTNNKAVINNSTNNNSNANSIKSASSNNHNKNKHTNNSNNHHIANNNNSYNRQTNVNLLHANLLNNSIHSNILVNNHSINNNQMVNNIPSNYSNYVDANSLNQSYSYSVAGVNPNENYVNYINDNNNIYNPNNNMNNYNGYNNNLYFNNNYMNYNFSNQQQYNIDDTKK